ncbi:hypothetical protein CANTEDRAFT_135451 [Yamadazyma tenuis ATCC 10573]|uniref:Uncharacterized protein n=2 Tax=Candida tenuis TaxID=2315449 RepID=G3BB71_CANTC|nr:uncharacterized protein CANTEDRAFT_135451 [Yamadazyma tenuis ATCC 10573]EGV61501.1 hypothetical protein CANTEDRAFT_135451 [Yamadazyma tenuis ATCC 10573]
MDDFNTTQEVVSHICVIRAYITVKTYGSQLEGRITKVMVVPPDSSEWETAPQLQDLGKQIKAHLYGPYANEVRRAIPGKLLESVSHSMSRMESDRIRNQRSNNSINSQHPDDRTRSPRLKQTSARVISTKVGLEPKKETLVKSENLEDGIVPGNHFDDLVDDNEEVDDESYQQDPSQVTDSLASQKRPSSPSIAFRDDNTMTIKNLKNISLTIDNIIYRVNAKVLGVVPEAKHICVKSFAVNADGTPEAQDPYVRPFKVIISDGETLDIHFDGKQLLEMVKVSVEELYAIPTMLEGLLEGIFGKVRHFRLFKKRIPLNGNVSIVVWTCKDLL